MFQPPCLGGVWETRKKLLVFSHTSVQAQCQTSTVQEARDNLILDCYVAHLCMDGSGIAHLKKTILGREYFSYLLVVQMKVFSRVQ